MEQLREHARLMESGMGLNQLVKVRYWRAAINRTFVHVTMCMFNVSAATMIIVRGCCRQPYIVLKWLPGYRNDRNSEATSKCRAGCRSL